MQHFATVTTGGLFGAAGAEPDASASLPILPYLPELIFGLIAFGIVLFVISKKVSPALEKVYTERRAAIEGGMDKADEAQREALALKAQYEAQLAEARTEAAHIREQAREQGAAIVAELRGQGQAEAARILESAGKQVEADRQQAFVELRGDLGRLSTDLASRIVGESLQEQARQSGIVERFLADLESGRISPHVSGSTMTPAPSPLGAPGADGSSS